MLAQLIKDVESTKQKTHTINQFSRSNKICDVVYESQKWLNRNMIPLEDKTVHTCLFSRFPGVQKS